jgi:hypothetical protein
MPPDSRALRVGVIEPGNHTDSLHDLCKVFHTDPGISVTAFVSGSVFRELAAQEYHRGMTWLVAEPGTSTERFLAESRNALAALDVLILNTVHRHAAAYADLRLEVLTILRVHNVHYEMNRRCPFSPRSLIGATGADLRYLARLYLLERDWRHARRLAARVHFVSFVDPALEAYARARGIVDPGRVFPPLPLQVPEPRFRKPAPGSPLRVTIPGAVDLRRKDYLLVARALRRVAPALSAPFELVFLGAPGPGARRVTEPLEGLSRRHPRFSFASFPGRVSQDAFDAVMTGTDLLLAPIHRIHYFKGCREVYGRSKISGSLLDAVRFLKPCILPEHYVLDPGRQGLFLPYRDAGQLEALLLGFAADPGTLDRYREPISAAMTAHDPAGQCARFRRHVERALGRG